MNISDIRKEYTFAELDRSNVSESPFEQFKIWFDAAIRSELLEPTAMVLSTVSPNGKPSSRVVLLKELAEEGFVFYTNYNSRKGQEMLENQNVALLFFWAELERQIRIEGTVHQISVEQSAKYFESRPYKSKLGAIVSPQSQVIENRALLEEKLNELSLQYTENDQIPKPNHWGGYVVKPNYFEFWQGRRSRLHDRISYELTNNLWQIARLAP